jgi:hypothetical protein
MAIKCVFAPLVLAGALCAGPAFAVDPAAKAASPSDQLQGKRAVRDKESGKLRAPTEEELAEMLQAERAARQARGESEPTGPGAPLLVRQHGGGMVSAVLGTDHLVTLKAQRRTDGKLEVTHSGANPVQTTAAPQRATE